MATLEPSTLLRVGRAGGGVARLSALCYTLLDSSVSSPFRQIKNVPPLCVRNTTHGKESRNQAVCAVWDAVVPSPGAPGTGEAVGSDSAAVGQAVGRVVLREGGHARVEAELPLEREGPMQVLSLPCQLTAWSHTRPTTNDTTRVL